MSEKRFVYHEEYFPLNVSEIIDNEIGETYDCEDATDVLNKLYFENKRLKEENEQLRTQLLICQQSKNDDGRFQVWQVPPIKKGMRVSTTTIDDEQKKDSKRWRWSE